MKLAKRKGWSRLCGWKKAFKSRGEIFHKPGRLEAKTRMKGKSQMVEMKRAERRKKWVKAWPYFCWRRKRSERKSSRQCEPASVGFWLLFLPDYSAAIFLNIWPMRKNNQKKLAKWRQNTWSEQEVAYFFLFSRGGHVLWVFWLSSWGWWSPPGLWKTTLMRKLLWYQQQTTRTLLQTGIFSSSGGIEVWISLRLAWARSSQTLRPIDCLQQKNWQMTKKHLSIYREDSQHLSCN